MFSSTARQYRAQHNRNIDNAPGRKEFAESDRESDLSDELEIVRKRHHKRLKQRKLATNSMDKD